MTPSALPLILSVALVAFSVTARAEDFPAGKSFLVQATSSQSASGMSDIFAPPLGKALVGAGLRIGGRDAALAASVELTSDVGRWYGRGEARRWLYRRKVTVGLSPAEFEIEQAGKLRPAFAVRASLVTADADRVDEMACLIRLAVDVMKTRYRPRGRIDIDGQVCAR
jgi:hypothetical protein